MNRTVVCSFCRRSFDRSLGDKDTWAFCPYCHEVTVVGVDKPAACQLCERTGLPLTEHHLVPRQKGGGGQDGETIEVCVPCSKQIHALFTNRELKRKFNTLKALKADERVQRYVEWVQKKNPNDIKYSGKGRFHG